MADDSASYSGGSDTDAWASVTFPISSTCSFFNMTLPIPLPLTLQALNKLMLPIHSYCNPSYNNPNAHDHIIGSEWGMQLHIEFCGGHTRLGDASEEAATSSWAAYMLSDQDLGHLAMRGG